MTIANRGEREVISGATVTGWAQGVGGIADSEMARRAGLRGRIVSNLFHFAQMTELLISYFGDEWFSAGKIHLTYQAPLNDGENLTPRARVVTERPAGARTVLSIWCENDRAEIIAAGEASCIRGGIQ